MPYIDLEQAQQFYQIPLFWILAAPVVVLGLIVLVVLYFGGRSWPELLAQFSTFLIVGVFLGASFTLPQVNEKQDQLRADQLSAVQKQIKDRYGISLTDRAMAEYLDYPRAKPSGELKSYGSFATRVPEESGDGFTDKRLTLVWTDGKMMLGELTDRQGFTPLKARS